MTSTMSSEPSNIAASSAETGQAQKLRLRKLEEHRIKKKRSHDSFFERASTIDTTAPNGAPSIESWYSKIFFAPLLAVSFILSLTLVSRQDRERRTHEHAHDSQDSLRKQWSWVGWKQWASPEPYRQFKHGSDDARQDPESSAWFLHKNRRAVTKLQLDDAWKLHGKVMLLIILALCFVAVGLYLGLTWAWTRWIDQVMK